MSMMKNNFEADLLRSPGLTADLCIKCNICTIACPVMEVSTQFLGPKAVGPQAERFRHPRHPIPDASVSLCSGCGTCSRVCPHGVAIAEMNAQAKARLVEQQGAPLRDHIIARPQMLGQWARPFASLANRLVTSKPIRWTMHHGLGIHRDAPLPRFEGKTLRQRQRQRLVSKPPADSNDVASVAYFHGCSTNHYEADLGELVIKVLEKLDCQVLLPPQVCCGLPLQSNGLFKAARRYAVKNRESLQPFVESGIPIVGSSTSCTLQLKHEYRAVLGMRDRAFDDLADATRDVFEWIIEQRWDVLHRARLEPVPGLVLYHPPCQLRSHWMGTPALQVLRLIPDLDIRLSHAECCGIAGTYGVKREKYQIAQDVGATLFDQIVQLQPDIVLTDSETCRWWLSANSGVQCLHPIELLARSMGITNTTRSAD
jgi:glycerol-3-phosphate dehydrogenase subunit C